MNEVIAVNCKRLALTTRHLLLVGSVFVAVGSLTYMAPADEKNQTGKSRDEVLATQRFELMQKCVAAAVVRSDSADFPASADMRWSPAGTLFEFKPIPNAPVPEKTPRRRLFQIRQIANRFASHEEVEHEKCVLRLLSQPVDRYAPSNAEGADGAILFFTFGTNPEVVLLIESDGMKWSYAAGRMTGAEVVVLTLDDAIVWEGAPLQSGRNSPFTGSIAPIAIPGIAADGSELQE